MRASKGELLKVRVSTDFKKEIKAAASELEIDISSFTRSALVEKIKALKAMSVPGQVTFTTADQSND